MNDGVDLNAGGFCNLVCGVNQPQRREGIVVLMSGRGKTDCDEIRINEIILDRQAKWLVENRAIEEGISTDQAFLKILAEAIREHLEKHNPTNWWSVK